MEIIGKWNIAEAKVMNKDFKMEWRTATATASPRKARL